ncbi:MAG: hypothetical protein HC927_00855 [Deltaproteobacteria bacterium]|nr:hypothetical protein [Deltaproteobacteria bacterium]
MQLHAWMLMSNHYHLVVTDTQGRLPEFARLLNSLVARALNFYYKRKESFWKPGSYSAVQLCSKSAILDKIAYTLANPVVAGLVPWVSHWKGAHSFRMDFDTERRALWPAFLSGFRKSMPEAEMLRLVTPPSYSTAAELLAALDEELDARAKVVQAQFKAERRRFLGMDAVWAQSWTDSPSVEERSSGISPRFAAKDPGILRRAIREWRAWLSAYRLALAAFREGTRDAEFPAGTYLMKVRFDVVVATQ